MATGADLLSALPLLSWRGLSAPCILAPFDFSHGQAERRYPYIDAAGHDDTGRDPLRFNVRLCFCETVEVGSFTGRWPAWREALFDGSSGDLIHPLLGTVRARVLTGHVDIKAEVRSGIFVDATFTETLDDIATPNTFTDGVALDAAVAAASTACAQFGISYPDGEGTTSLLGAFKSIKGSLFSAELSVTGAINSFVANVASMVDDVEALNDARAWPALDNLLSVYQAAARLREQAAKVVARSVGQKTTGAPTTLDLFATSVGNSTGEVMGLNLQALRSPIVPKGTVLRYYLH